MVQNLEVVCEKFNMGGIFIEENYVQHGTSNLYNSKSIVPASLLIEIETLKESRHYKFFSELIL
jgi:hypothetical protein